MAGIGRSAPGSRAASSSGSERARGAEGQPPRRAGLALSRNVKRRGKTYAVRPTRLPVSAAASEARLGQLASAPVLNRCRIERNALVSLTFPVGTRLARQRFCVRTSQSTGQTEGAMSKEAETLAHDRDEHIEHPAKLLRITQMVRALLDEVRQTPLDESARKRMRDIYENSLKQLKDALSEDLQRELELFVVPFDRNPSESEIRVAQAQLV